MLKLLHITEQTEPVISLSCPRPRCAGAVSLEVSSAYCTELDRDWEEGLTWIMLAAREAVQEHGRGGSFSGAKG